MSEKVAVQVAEKPSQAPRAPIPPNTILIGKKPAMNYATAVMTHVQSGSNELTVKARGRAISRAIDVIEVVRRRFLGEKLSIKGIVIGTEVLGEPADPRNVSTIEIKLEMKQ